MEGKRKAEFMAVAVQPKKPRNEVVVHGGEKGVVQSVSVKALLWLVLLSGA